LFCLVSYRYIAVAYELQWVKVGYHKHNKLYVKLGTGYNKTYKVYKYELLDRDAMRNFAKDGTRPLYLSLSLSLSRDLLFSEGTHTICAKEGTSKEGGKWFLEAAAVVEGGKLKGTSATATYTHYYLRRFFLQLTTCYLRKPVSCNLLTTDC
jgi:hypothetical protein